MAKSTLFTGFGQPAHLYSQYAAVVDQMRSLFLADVEAFIDGLRDRIQTLVPSVIMHEYRDNRDKKNPFRRWWLSDDGKSHREHVYVWQPHGDPGVVEPGVLRIHANAWPAFRRPYKHVFAAVGNRLKTTLPSSCTVSKGGPNSFFGVSIRYGTSSDPVGDAAPPLAEVLRALYDEEKRVVSLQPQAAP